jgi:Putative stress-induced transcription regulator
MSKASRQFKVPDQLANLYDFANSLDLRHFIHRGVQQVPGDELAGPRELAAWMSARGLLRPGSKITPAMLATTLALRSGIRAFLQCEPAARRDNTDVLRSLNQAIGRFPLVVEAGDGGSMKLQPAHHDALAGLGIIVAELHDARPAARWTG